MSIPSFPERFFVTGTDTDAGKTLVSTLLMLALDCRYYKPVQSGSAGETDTQTVRRMSGLPDDRFCQETYVTRTPCSPDWSARIDNIAISLEHICHEVEALNGPLLVEGAGGIYVPINEREFMLDLMRALNYPVILVTRSGLGTINHTLLSIQALRQAGITLYGIIMNGPLHPENRKAIENFGATTVLAEVPVLADLSPAALATCAAQLFAGRNK